MLKKWKKTIKVLATTVIILIYATIGLFSSETLKRQEKSKKFSTFVFDSALTTEKYFGTVKTIVAYSSKFKLRKELEDRIKCDAENFPAGEEEKSAHRWTYDRKFDLQIFSAYYDQRPNPYHYVRIIALLPRNSSFYCQIWYQNNETISYTTQKAVIHEIWSSKWGAKNKSCEGDDHLPALISCPAPLPKGPEFPPSWVSFVDKSCSGSGAFVQIAPPPPDRPSDFKNFVVCVKPLDPAKVDDRNLGEWLALNQRLGAEEVVVYVPDAADLENHKKNRLLVRREFAEPSQRGPCPSRTFEESIWYKRKMEIIAYNDCFYSNLYHTKFVIPLDVDEIIVPKTGNNWFEAFRSHFLNAKLSKGTKNSWPRDTDNYASFSVRNAYFFPAYPKDAIIRSLMLPKRDQNVPKKLVKAFSQKRTGRPGSIFDRTVRSYRLSPESDSVKSFVHVPKTLSVFNHYAFHVLGDVARQLVFPANVFQLNHYRNSCDPLLIDGCRQFLSQVVHDDTLQRFRRAEEAR